MLIVYIMAVNTYVLCLNKIDWLIDFIGDLLCGELHEMTGTKHRVEDEKDAVPQTGTAVHSDEVEVKVLRDAVDDC